MNLAELSWTELADQSHPIVLVPTGALEQHGPHLPLDTDTRIATAVAADFGPTASSVPALNYGASGEHAEFPGTVSIGHEALRALLVEYGRSACIWAAKVVFVNAHGGNQAALISAVQLLRYEGRDVAWFACTSPHGDAHAGHTETALMLTIAPQTVRMPAAREGNTMPLRELLPRLRAGALRTVTPNGVLGDPRGATAQEGAEILAAMRSRLRAALNTWRPDEHGRIG